MFNITIKPNCTRYLVLYFYFSNFGTVRYSGAIVEFSPAEQTHVYCIISIILIKVLCLFYSTPACLATFMMGGGGGVGVVVMTGVGHISYIYILYS